MATIPFTYENNNPVVDPSLLPLQLALANYMALGNPLAFAPNTRFLQAMKNYCDSFVLSPLDFDPRTGFPRVPDISRNITGIFYLAKGDDLYVYRRAQDCGPDENRYELAYIGKRSEIATGTWVYYGPLIGSGRVSSGSTLGDGSLGGFDGPSISTSPEGTVSLAGDPNNGDGGNGGNGNGDGNAGSTASC